MPDTSLNIPMFRLGLYVLFLVTFPGCLNNNWDLTIHKGVEYDNLTMEAIFFENADRGVVGGHTLIKDSSADNDFKLSMIPVVYYTVNGGRDWQKVELYPKTKDRITGIFLSGKILLCRTDSGFYESADFTKDFQLIKKAGDAVDSLTISKNSS